MQRDDVFTLSMESLALIQDGQAPFYPIDNPVNGTRVRDSLRQFEKDVKAKNIVIPDKEIDKRSFIRARWFRIHPKYVSEAFALIKDTFPEYWENSKNMDSRAKRLHLLRGEISG